MSLILDALKKLEQDKAARRGKSVEIGPAILKGTPRRSSIRPVVMTLTLLAVVAAAAFAVKTFFFSSSARNHAETAPKETATPAPTTSPAPVTAVPPAALPTPEQAKPLAPPATAAPQPQGAAPAPPPTQPQSAPAPSNLKVTGIAWQDERRLRRAVVNGMLVGEGSFVAGARVAEIRVDRVRFTLEGQEVTAPLLTPLNAEQPADKGTGSAAPVAAPPAAPAPAAVTAAPAPTVQPAPTRTSSHRPRRHVRNPGDYEP